MIPAVLTGAAAAVVAMLVMLRWLPHPRPGRWLLAGSAVAAGCAGAVMAGQASLWPLLGICLTAAAVSWHDGLTQRIPDTLTAVTGAVVIVAAVLAGGGLGEWGDALLAAAVLSGAYMLLALFASMGLGDVKYALPVGFSLGWSGWAAVWQATMLAFLIGVVYALIMMSRGRSKHTYVAFGPFMAIGGVLTGVLTGLLR